MVRVTLTAIVFTVVVVMSLGSSMPPGAAQEPLPTPRGQLGGREELDPGQPAIVATVPPLWPSPAASAPTATATHLPAVTGVSVEAAWEPFRRNLVWVEGRAGDGRRFGAGWAWDDSGTIVTAASLVLDADRVVAVAQGSEPVVATVVAIDEATGVAVLVANGLSLRPVPGSLRAAATGDDIGVVGISPDGLLVVGAGRVVSAGHGAECGVSIVLGDMPDPQPSWLEGAPVVARGGLLGVVLPARSDPRTASPAAETSGSAAGMAEREGVLCVVSVERIAALVASTGRATLPDSANTLAGSPSAGS